MADPKTYYKRKGIEKVSPTGGTEYCDFLDDGSETCISKSLYDDLNRKSREQTGTNVLIHEFFKDGEVDQWDLSEYLKSLGNQKGSLKSEPVPSRPADSQGPNLLDLGHYSRNNPDSDYFRGEQDGTDLRGGTPNPWKQVERTQQLCNDTSRDAECRDAINQGAWGPLLDHLRDMGISLIFGKFDVMVKGKTPGKARDILDKIRQIYKSLNPKGKVNMKKTFDKPNRKFGKSKGGTSSRGSSRGRGRIGSDPQAPSFEGQEPNKTDPRNGGGSPPGGNAGAIAGAMSNGVKYPSNCGPSFPCGLDKMPGYQSPFQGDTYIHSGWRNYGQQILRLDPVGILGAGAFAVDSSIRSHFQSVVYPTITRTNRHFIRMSDNLNQSDLETLIDASVEALAIRTEMAWLRAAWQNGIKNPAVRHRAEIFFDSDGVAAMRNLELELGQTFMFPRMRELITWLYSPHLLRPLEGSPLVQFSFENTTFDSSADLTSRVNVMLAALRGGGVPEVNARMLKIFESYALNSFTDPQITYDESWLDIWFNHMVAYSASPDYWRRTTSSRVDKLQYLTINQCPGPMQALMFNALYTGGASDLILPGFIYHDPFYDRPWVIDSDTGLRRIAATLAERSTEGALFGTHVNLDDNATPGNSYSSVYGCVNFWTDLLSLEQAALLLYEDLFYVKEMKTTMSQRTILT